MVSNVCHGIPANLVNPEIGVTKKGGEHTTQLVGYRGKKIVFKFIGYPNKAFLSHFVLNMHDEWPKCHKLDKLNENVKNRSTPMFGL